VLQFKKPLGSKISGENFCQYFDPKGQF